MVVTHLRCCGRTRCLQPVDDVGVRSVIMLVKSVSDNAAARAWESRHRDWNVIMRMKIVRGMCRLKSLGRNYMGNSWIFSKRNVKECTLGKADGLEICKSIHFWCMIQVTTDCFCILHAKVCWDKREGGGMKAKTNWCCRKNVHKAPGSAEECSKHDWLQSCFAKKVEHRLICFCRAERNVSSLKICRYHPTLPSFTLGSIFQIFSTITICYPGAVSWALTWWFLFPYLENLPCPAVSFCLSQYWFQVWLQLYHGRDG